MLPELLYTPKGDKVFTLRGEAEIVQINNITRNGLYNPLTSDGTIIVEEIVASTYTTPVAGRQYLEINHDLYNLAMTMMRNEKMLSYHDAVHMISTPYRQVCSIARLSSINLYNIHNEENVLKKN